jgi:iron complex transport system ATP-binding protein
MRILRDYARAGQAVVIAIHDLSLAARYCDRLCLMDDGRVVKTDSIGAVLNDATLSPVFRVAVHVDLDNSPPVVLAR